MKKKIRMLQKCTNVENSSWIDNLCIYISFKFKITIIHVMHLKNDCKKKHLSIIMFKIGRSIKINTKYRM